ncbi:MAG: carbon-nitrogen hydrolase family protein [Actinobacteria bacterium]|nr:carbon-nitrogen hydrolase family protein [Actinomycetota bacterium]
MQKVTVAAVQATPVFLDREATVAKVVGLVKEAGSAGAGLIVFPETFIPNYPDWVWRAPAWGEAFEGLTARLRDQAVEVPSPATEAIGKAAKAAKAWISIGVNERESDGGGTLFNTQLMFAPDGTLAGRHRKLMPTGGERLVWGFGDGSDLEVHETPFGRVGGLICWENLMPLARVAMYAKGVDIWTAPTWDNGENWVANLRHIAREGRCYVIGVTTLLRGSDIPDDVPGRELWGGAEDVCNDGWSAIVDPDGQMLAGPLVGEEGILTAEIDAEHARAERYKFDPVGHYSRPDVFRLIVDESPKPTVTAE